MVEKTPELTQDEMVEILKEIARDGSNAAARIAAIRQLREMDSGAVVSGFDDLDGPARMATVSRIRTK